MKKNIQPLRIVTLLALMALSCQLTVIQAQDSLYIYQGGSMVAKRAVLQIDSITFTKPIVKTSACGAYLGAGNTLYKQFLCRNLGAAGDLYSGGLTYDAADNGDLYQWGRPTDGHEKRNSATNSTLATSNTPGNVGFITTSSSPHDWRSGGANDTRWTNATKAANDPCPIGYKVPSQAQWAAVVANNTTGTWTTGYQFGANLFLPASGCRDYVDGSLLSVGSDGLYWSSTVNGTNAYYLAFINGNVTASLNYYRALGFSVRCIAEGGVAATVPSLSATTIASNIAATTASSGGNITADGGAAVTARGVCWSTSANPTVDLSTKTTDGSGTGSFTSSLTGLTASTLHYVRAYATNSIGTSYGEQISFSTAAAAVTSSACGAYTAPGVWKTFMCHNLGANTNLDAMTYSDGINGDLYQWGRPTDGHEKRTSGTTTTLATTNTPGNVGFITTLSPPYDWRSEGGNDTRWTDATKTANDPCPAGYKVPSQAQWAGVVANNTKGTWASGYQFGANLFLPASGSRWDGNGSLSFVGSQGYYWSSTIYGSSAYHMTFDYGSVNATDSRGRANGYSIRCVAE